MGLTNLFTTCAKCKVAYGLHLGDQCPYQNSTFSPSTELDLPKSFDPITKPSHYNVGKIEVRDFILDQKLDFPAGSAIKYICRAGRKDPAKEIEDLEKAIDFLQFKVRSIRKG